MANGGKAKPTNQKRVNLITVLRSNCGVYSSTAQGFILKTMASTYTRPKPDGRVEQQAGSSGTSNHYISLFNGKRVSCHQSSGGTAKNLDDSRRIEDAFWQQKMLQGRQITTACVITAYGNDRTSLRSGFFLQKLCLRNILHNNRNITPDQVVRAFNLKPDRSKSELAIACFKAECCLKGLSMNDQRLTPAAVVKDFPDSPEGRMALAHFKEKCCLSGLALNDRQFTPDVVVKDFPDSPKGRLALAHFKEHCYLKKLILNGQQVTTEAVVKGFQAAGATRALGRFKEHCCLKGVKLNGQLVSAEAVVKDFQAVNAKLELARFKQQCCLLGLALNDRQVTPEAVVKDFQAAKSTLGLARFKAECCLRGVPLNGQQMTPDEVVRDFQAANATLALARFKEQCCMNGLVLNGQQVTPDMVVKDFQAANATLEQARLKAECCLRGLPLNDRQVTPESVVRDFQALRATRELARFQAECCLRGLTLNGRQVAPDVVVKDYARGGWLLESAIFYAQLALSGRALNGRYLDNKEVLAAFHQAPGDHSSKQVRYLIQRLRQSWRYDETKEVQDLLQAAWRILDNISVKGDEQHRLQCILKFMAMHHELRIDHKRVSAEQVLHSIKILRRSFQNSRLHFFFLAYCYINSQSVNRRQIHKDQVMACLQSFPEASKLRHALSCWFEQCSPASNIMDELLFKSDFLSEVIPDTESFGRRATSVEVSVANPDREKLFPYQAREYRDETKPVSATWAMIVRGYQPLKQWPQTGATSVRGVPQLNALTLKTLEVIQEINGANTAPTILITGSYSRFLQNLCPVFNDIDIICTTEEVARALFDKLQALNTGRDSEIPTDITISSIPGCQAIKLPKAYNIHLIDGDLGTKAMEFQVSVDDRVIHENAEQSAVRVPGVERPVWYLSFAEETRLMNDTLEHLAENLEPLTEQLQQGEVFELPRTLLFNNPMNTGERIYGLLMRSLLTLNKARQFIALYSKQQTGRSDFRTDQLQEQQQRLHTLTAKLQTKLNGHVCRHDFEHRVNGCLSTMHNDYQIKRKGFIKVLLAMMHPEYDQVNMITDCCSPEHSTQEPNHYF